MKRQDTVLSGLRGVFSERIRWKCFETIWLYWIVFEYLAWLGFTIKGQGQFDPESLKLCFLINPLFYIFFNNSRHQLCNDYLQKLLFSFSMLWAFTSFKLCGDPTIPHMYMERGGGGLKEGGNEVKLCHISHYTHTKIMRGKKWNLSDEDKFNVFFSF